MWPFHLKNTLLSRRSRFGAGNRSNRSTTVLGLECLETRVVPSVFPVTANGAAGFTATVPNSTSPLSVAMPATLLQFHSLTSSPMASPPPPTPFQAAIALFFDGANLGVGEVNQNIFHIPEEDAFPVPPSALNASIAFNSPYAGPFASFFVLVGEVVGAQYQYQLQILSLQTF
jgi:hypothetical protein